MKFAAIFARFNESCSKRSFSWRTVNDKEKRKGLNRFINKKFKNYFFNSKSSQEKF